MTDTTPTPADRPADQLRAAIAETLRRAACTGGCDSTETECAASRMQPVVYTHGVLTEVWGTPEVIADAVLSVLPAPALAVARQLLGTSTAESDRRCVCGDPIEWMTHPDGPGWIHSPGSDTRCLDARPAAAPPAPAAAPLAEVWTVWREDEPVYAHYTTEEAARQGTIDCWQEDEPSCPDYSWRQDGPRLELVVGGEYGGVYASRHRVYGAPPAPADRAAVLREVEAKAREIVAKLWGDGTTQTQMDRAGGARAVEWEIGRLAAVAAAGVQPPTSDRAAERLDLVRAAVRLHRLELITTAELYAVIEAQPGTPPAAPAAPEETQ
ncbi:hypothetical protein CG717_16320 [Streptomyces sp. CB02613]|uniref:hypothetical protein n=1 Tax=Streptomyces sp. CB02613 TaxID=2020328 RepID=UPI000C27B0DE|nr:hypothetical protein [Streptomyces sp. CB02613]PJN31330.1 hypothetical protein CG717_16320 [Streptomyces sp. CB02613]